MKTDSDYWSCAPFMTCALQAPPTPSLNTRFSGDAHQHQLNLIQVRCSAIKTVLRTCSYHSADCNTDHSLVCCKIRIKPKKFHHTKTKGNAAVTTHTQQELQALKDRFSQACKDFGRTISVKKTNVLVQDTMELPTITIDDYELGAVDHFTDLDPPSQTTSSWTLRSIRGLERLPQHLLALLHECGPTPN